jgi:hypothetical protein
VCVCVCVCEPPARLAIKGCACDDTLNKSLHQATAAYVDVAHWHLLMIVVNCNKVQVIAASSIRCNQLYRVVSVVSAADAEAKLLQQAADAINVRRPLVPANVLPLEKLVADRRPLGRCVASPGPIEILARRKTRLFRELGHHHKVQSPLERAEVLDPPAHGRTHTHMHT